MLHLFKQLWFFTCFLLPFGLGAGAAYAQEGAQPGEDTQAANIRILSVGVESIRHYPYYGMCGEEFCGFARDLIDSFAADQGFTIHYVPLPINRLHRAMIDGRIDLKFPASPIWATEEKLGHEIFYTEPVIDFIDGIMSLASTPDKAPLRLGTIRGFTLNKALIAKAGTEQVMEAGTDQDLIQLLIRGRVDGIYSNIAVLNYVLGQEKLATGTLVFRSDLPYQRSSYYVSSREKALVDNFDRWMVEHAGKLTALKAQYELGLSGALTARAR